MCRSIHPNFPMAGLMISVQGLFPDCGVRAGLICQINLEMTLSCISEQADRQVVQGQLKEELLA